MLADVFRCFAPSYLMRFAGRLLASHARALADILRCRTPACGGHLYLCADCGERHLVAHSCRNRHCPACGGATTEEWLSARRGELLPTAHFHLVFTLPAALRAVCRRNQKAIYGLLFQAAYGALQRLADDPRHVGGRLAVLAVLHTWTRALVYHPHIHCLTPAGGLGTDGRWRPSNPAFLVPVKALSRLFRGMFLAKLEAALPEVAIPPSVRRKDWVVHCKAAPRSPERVLQYLGRYLQRVAITSARLVGFDQDTVSFRYRSPDSGPWRTMKLPGHEFLRRYLQHVLPRDFHKVRYFGLWHPRRREDLRRVAAQLALAAAKRTPAAAGPAQAAPPPPQGPLRKRHPPPEHRHAVPAVAASDSIASGSAVPPPGHHDATNSANECSTPDASPLHLRPALRCRDRDRDPLAPIPPSPGATIRTLWHPRNRSRYRRVHPGARRSAWSGGPTTREIPIGSPPLPAFSSTGVLAEGIPQKLSFVMWRAT